MERTFSFSARAAVAFNCAVAAGLAKASVDIRTAWVRVLTPDTAWVNDTRHVLANEELGRQINMIWGECTLLVGLAILGITWLMLARGGRSNEPQPRAAHRCPSSLQYALKDA